jgi:hypothetical protein
MDVELTHFLGRKPYERLKGDINHRNGSYVLGVTLELRLDTSIPKSYRIIHGKTMGHRI